MRESSFLLGFIDRVGEAEGVGGAGTVMNNKEYTAAGSEHVFRDLE